MRKKIVILIYHGEGHINACLKLVKVLQPKYDVIFAGHTYFQQYASLHQLNFVSLTSLPFGLNFEKWVNQNEKKKNVWWHVVKDRWTDRLFLEREKELSEKLHSISPDIVLIDQWQSTDLVVLYPLLKEKEIRVGFINTMLPTTIVRGMPPLNSTIIFDKNSNIGSVVFKAHLKHLLKTLLDKLRYLGKDNQAILQKWINKNAIPSMYQSKALSLFSTAFENVEELILAPYEFQFDGYPVKKTHHYLGFSVDRDRKEFADAEFNSSLQILLQKAAQQPLVLCCFGTVHYHKQKMILAFLKKLINVASKNNWLLVVATAHNLSLPTHDADHVYFFRRIPQLALLKHAKVFITHGGLNSVKEAIISQVPMLVYPMSNDFDQNGNAARVAYRKIGLRGSVAKDSMIDIEQKLARLMSDNSFKTSLIKLKDSESRYTEEKLLEMIRNLRTLD